MLGVGIALICAGGTFLFGLLSIKLHDLEKRIINQQHNVRELLRHARQGLPIACPECQTRWAPGDSRMQFNDDDDTHPVTAAVNDTPAEIADHHSGWIS